MNFCPHCGTAVQSATQKWCGNCGSAIADQPTPTSTPTSAPSTAGPQAPPSPDPARDRASTGGATTQVIDEPVAAGPPGPASRSSVPWVKVLVALLAIAGITVAAIVALRFVFPPGGASSPEGAVEGIADAVGQQDPVAAVRMLNPGEAEGLDDLVTAARDRLKEASLSDDRLVDSVDVSLSDVSYDVDEIDDNAARVYLSGGDVKVTYDPAKLPSYMRDARSAKTWSRTFSLEEVVSDADFGDSAFLTVVKTDGRWYVSPVATVAEYAADATGVRGGDFEDFDTEIESRPEAADPEEALDDFVEAVESGDVDDIAAVLPANQGNLVRAYSRTLSTWRDQGQLGYTLSSSRVRATTREDGDSAEVAVEDADLEVSGYTAEDSGATQVSLGDDCIEIDGDEACARGRFAKLTGIDDLHVVTTRDDGQWRVDPVATVVSYLDRLVENVPSDVALRALDLPALQKPSAALTVGQKNAVKLGESGMAVVTVPAKTGQVVVIRGAEDDEVSYQALAGTAPTVYGYGNFATSATRDGDVRVALTQEAVRAGTVEVTPTVVTPRQSDGPPTGAKPGEAFRFTAKGTYNTVGDSYYMCMYHRKGTCEETYETELDGEYLFVSLSDDAGLQEVTTGFSDGTQQYEGYLDAESEETITFTATEGDSLLFTATPDSSLDVAIDAINEDASADENLEGGTETLYFSAPYTGEYEITLRSFSAGGSYTLTME